MAADFCNPIAWAIRPDDTADTLFGYRRSQERGKDGQIADFYDYGWDRPFHFASGKRSSLRESLAGHPNFRDESLGLQPRTG